MSDSFLALDVAIGSTSHCPFPCIPSTLTLLFVGGGVTKSVLPFGPCYEDQKTAFHLTQVLEVSFCPLPPLPIRKELPFTEGPGRARPLLLDDV